MDRKYIHLIAVAAFMSAIAIGLRYVVSEMDARYSAEIDKAMSICERHKLTKYEYATRYNADVDKLVGKSFYEPNFGDCYVIRDAWNEKAGVLEYPEEELLSKVKRQSR
jgi:hypothetical protein